MRSILVTAALAAAGTATLAETVTRQNEFLLTRYLAFEGTLVGGVSSLDHDPAAGLWWAIRDDQEGSGAPRWYGLDVTRGPGGVEGVVVREVVTFQTPEGAPFADGTVDPRACAVCRTETFSGAPRASNKRSTG